ncbi:MAG: uroporphyrinogen decarboxylase [Gammaproteobacteria bacterium]
MTDLKNSALLQVLQGKTPHRLPIWLMRQAGRYLPEYRAIREKIPNFLALCKTPELACEVTLQPLRRFDLDAAIIFSDILVVPHAMGMELHYLVGEGPSFPDPIRTATQIAQLQEPDPMDALGYVSDAISLTQKGLQGSVPLIGFAGSPWTVATYMVEGGSSKQFSVIKALCYKEPALMHTLLEKVTRVTIAYLLSQIYAGVQVVQLFDTWGGILTSDHYEQFSLQYMKQIITALRDDARGAHIPIILFTKQGGQWLDKIADTGCDGIGLSSEIEYMEARQKVKSSIVLQGNLDPAALFAEPAIIESEVKKIINQVTPGDGFIFNLGHGIQQKTPPEHVAFLVDTVHQLSY